MIAMGTSGLPRLFIADEVITFLDVTIGAQILRLFKEMNRDDGITIIIITHNMGIVGEICNRVAVMYAGQVVESCSTMDLFNEPLHPYTRGLLSAIPYVDSDVSILEEIPGTIPNLIDPPSGCRFNPRCPYATEVCKNDQPKMEDVNDGHLISCHHYREAKNAR